MSDQFVLNHSPGGRAGQLSDEALGLLLADLGIDTAALSRPERFQQALVMIARRGSSHGPIPVVQRATRRAAKRRSPRLVRAVQHAGR
jgi:hypothetical protein